MTTLDEIGTKYGTDKASFAHDYLRWYATMLEPMRDKPVNLLEMGVWRGASLMMWEEYFQNGKIVGMDIADLEGCHGKYPGNRVTIVQGDQTRSTDLDRAIFALPTDQPDIINDDAGHQPEDQMSAFKHLMPRLAPGGLYLLEDIIAPTVAEFFAKLAQHCILRNWVHDIDPWIREHGNLVDSVSFYREAVAVRMKGTRTWI